MTIEEFRNKYGSCGLSILMEAFIKDAPPFKNDVLYAEKIGKMLVDLESALELIPMNAPDDSYYGA